MKSSELIEHIMMEASMSQIHYLGPSSDFIT